LQADHIDLAHGLVVLQHFGDVLGRITKFFELAHQLDGIFKRQFGTRADRKVRGVHRVAHQHHMAVAVEVRPVGALDTLKVQPR